MTTVRSVDPPPSTGDSARAGWAISLQGVRRSRAGNPVLRDIDLEIRSGEIIAFVGPIGCGASTLLRAVTGAERPDAGVITVDGRAGAAAPRIPEVRDRTPVARFGRVGTSIAAMTRRVGRPDAEAEATRLAQVVGLGALDKLVHRLAHGDRQRWALARALATGPGALALDDPLAALPTAARAETRDRVVHELRARRVTTLWVTRDTAEAAAVADRLVVMDRGRVIAAGSPDELYTRVDDAVVAEVLGPVNAVPGIVDGSIVEVWGREVPLARPAADGHCEVIVRPENVLVIGSDDPGMDAVVEATTFLGSARRSTVRTSDGVQVVVEHPSELRLDPEDHIRVALAPAPATIRPIG
ncbi:ABC transporter ATP-binding protein [Microbacterium testaceum]|uniref:ABC transporter ATP-binding protein n=1 Tax=Microbacterium testaceum TaxID=2033 RepID=UPI00073496B9|nr:ABC transporter ATP-binding protein [Microbacterium testaceum]